MTGLYNAGPSERSDVDHFVVPLGDKGICGRRIARVELRDPHPDRSCGICMRLARPACPYCGGPVEIEDGAVEVHLEWRVRRHGMRETTVRCPGSGLPVAVEAVAA